MRRGNREGLAERVLLLVVIAIGSVCIGNAIAIGGGGAGPRARDAGVEVDVEDAGEIRIPLDQIAPEDPLIRARAVAAFSSTLERKADLGGSFHLAVAPWVTRRFSGFLEFGIRRHQKQPAYMELALVPTVTVGSLGDWNIDIAPVLGGAMGYFDRGGKRVQALMGVEGGLWWTVADTGSPDSSNRYPRLVNELKDRTDRYKVRCKDNVGEAQECRRYEEDIALILKEVDNGGKDECAFPRKKHPPEVPQLLARIDRCLNAIADRRKPDDRVRVGLNLRLLRIAGRDLPSLLTFDVGLGVAY